MKSIKVKEYGGAENLLYLDVDKPVPKDGEALIKIEAAGVNFIDVYHRTGLYPLPLPFTPGSEAAGTVETVGANEKEIRAGDRVAYAMSPGSYAEYATVPIKRLVKIPDGVDFNSAAAVMLQGMTAHYLVTSTYRLKKEDSVLIHAAAGGVGLLLIQMAKRIGARVFGTVSTAEKANLALETGADAVIIYTEQDFQQAVRDATGGTGVQVVYDSVGKTTFAKSLDALAPRGMLVLFGQSSGVVPPIDAGLLAKKGSLFLTRPSLAHYIATPEELKQRADEVFSWIMSGELKLRIDRTFPLAEAFEAHRQLESRATSGKLLLKP